MSDLCGKCRGTGRKPGRFMTPTDGHPCPMCGGRGRGGRAAGIPPERYSDWILARWRPDGLEGAKGEDGREPQGVFG